MGVTVPLRRYPWNALLAHLTTVCLVAACGGGDLFLPGDGGAAAIRVVDGDGQSAPVGQPLTSPIVVEVTNAAGEPVVGATVAFTFTSAGAGAEIAPSTVRTGDEGLAQVHILLGDKVGLQTGEARVVVEGATPPSTTFTALAVATGGNSSPRAEFDWDCDGLTCQFIDASTDPDGSVTGWSWRFGDGSTSTEREPSHAYAAAGSYEVTLTVTDDDGAEDESSQTVSATSPSAPPSNQAPQAEFEVSCEALRCTFTDLSTDEDGSIESRAWDFGDGETSSQRNPSHTYQSAGAYEVELVVTDDDGADDSRTRLAEPEAPPGPPPPPPPPSNEPPRAEFEVTCQELRCTFVDRSDDDDGSIVSWSWSFGDGATSSERNPSHTYASAGNYEVLLVVTDDDGAADTRTHSVRAEAPPPPPPPPANEPPKADFDVDCEGLSCAFEDRSEDEDGTIVSWAWSFGDGATSSERNPVHTYAAKGHYNVSLTVTDDQGGTDSKNGRADAKD